MKPTKSQFFVMNPSGLQQAAQSVDSLADQLSTNVRSVESAQRTVEENLVGKAGDDERESVTPKIADLHRELDTLTKIRTTLDNASSGLTTATNNLKSIVEAAESAGYTIADDWSLTPPPGTRSTGANVSQAQELKKNLDQMVEEWDEADKNAGDALKKTVEDITGQQTGPAPQPAPQPQPDPPPSPKQPDPQGGDHDEGGGDDHPSPGPDPSGHENPAKIAEQYEHVSAKDLMKDPKYKDLGMKDYWDDTNCCANFVSAVLVKAGVLRPDQQTLLVKDVYNNLQKKPPEGPGWVPVPAGQDPPPGAVAVFDPGHDGHVEIVDRMEKGADGKMHVVLVGSNNTGPHGNGPQVVSEDKWSAEHRTVVYLMPPPGAN